MKLLILSFLILFSFSSFGEDSASALLTAQNAKDCNTAYVEQTKIRRDCKAAAATKFTGSNAAKAEKKCDDAYRENYTELPACNYKFKDEKNVKKEECTDAYTELTEAQDELKETCGGSGANECVEKAKECKKCSQSVTSAKDTNNRRTRRSSSRSKDKHCQASTVSGSNAQQPGPLDQITSSVLGNPNQSSRVIKPKKSLSSDGFKVFASCPLVSEKDIKRLEDDGDRFIKGAETNRDLVRELEEQINAKQQELAQAPNDFQNILKQINDTYNGTGGVLQGITRSLEDAEQDLADQITSAQEQVRRISREIADFDIQIVNSQSQRDRDLRGARLSCIQQAQTLLEQRLARRTEQIQSGTYSTQSIANFYSRVRNNSNSRDRAYVRYQASECEKQEAYKESIDNINQSHTDRVRLITKSRDDKRQEVIALNASIARLQQRLAIQVGRSREDVADSIRRRDEEIAIATNDNRTRTASLNQDIQRLTQNLTTAQQELQLNQTSHEELQNLLDLRDTKIQLGEGKSFSTALSSATLVSRKRTGAIKACRCDSGNADSRCNSINSAYSEPKNSSSDDDAGIEE